MIARAATTLVAGRSSGFGRPPRGSLGGEWGGGGLGLPIHQWTVALFEPAQRPVTAARPRWICTTLPIFAPSALRLGGTCDAFSVIQARPVSSDSRDPHRAAERCGSERSPKPRPAAAGAPTPFHGLGSLRAARPASAAHIARASTRNRVSNLARQARTTPAERPIRQQTIAWSPRQHRPERISSPSAPARSPPCAWPPRSGG